MATASIGPALFPGASTFPGTSVFPGQGSYPILRCRVSFDPAVSLTSARTPPDANTPGWQDVTTKLRSFSTSRGRDQDYGEISAGTASVVLDNRDRSFDPTFVSSPYYPNVRPLNRVWLYEEFSADVEDVFRGYVESWNQRWPAPGGITDAVVEVTASDEFMVMALEQLPSTDPPEDSYASVVGFDQPADYFNFSARAVEAEQSPPWEFVPADPYPPARTAQAWHRKTILKRRRWPH